MPSRSPWVLFAVAWFIFGWMTTEMVNTSLNWVSLVGLLLFLYTVPAAAIGAAQISFVLQRRADAYPATFVKTAFIVFQSLGRLICMPLAALIMFFQGWRLDPILQFAVTLLALGVVFESASSIASDHYRWKFRTGNAKAKQ
ncbi:MAG: hypothetical protein F4Z75_01290 [Synechococcus sp. SB0668_bin_15]|nr:hypothetical protein [Synechococcus sp. SB0668_bin_15]MXZ82192.1 hypothetical protein [Synechococcus sp. SB0666_bin_14]MYA90613.1 hypothetical protein [Synechococcus sp. SB0663_bin_10]MYC50125.1 hypothetical protein [Synechococcus sp. SB0662_bin_14]MYG47098.1 hypothetical protein [Synechococcus sp. SB0675_bin_6]MYJ59023.1 hypothetical protein [Synechococcus sp. SB0672_bin_6]MYK91187.1 hypothetical protein [Synechococcus sp. SB0669_bin_8]